MEMVSKALRNWKIHALALVILVAAEKIGNIAFSIGPAKVVLIPMLYAFVLGALCGVFKLVNKEDMLQTSPLVGVTYGRITLRRQRSRWGSCSSKGNLSFNCLLMLTPPEVMLRSVGSFWYSISVTDPLRSIRPFDAERMRSQIIGMPFSGSATPSTASTSASCSYKYKS